ncbi:MAG: aminotransferase class IV [Planctomycetales bacterium]
MLPDAIVTLSPPPEPIAYLDGVFLHLSQAKVSIFDLGLVQGAGVTEMVRTFAGIPFRLDEHLDRLFRSMHAVGFRIPQARDELAALVHKIVAHNFRLVPATHDLGIVLFVTPGLNRTYVGAAGMPAESPPTVCIHTFPLPFELWAGKIDAGQRLVIPSIRHVPAECIDPRIKMRSRMHWYLADREARGVDPQAQALLLDHAGAITETSTANFFIVTNGEIRTPGGDVALGGVSQCVVRELAVRDGVPFRPATLHPDDAFAADEAFTSSTPYCLLPVTRLDGREIGGGRPGPIFARMMAAWNELAGLDIIEQLRQGAADRIAATAGK